MDLISVIVPVYKVESYLDRCVQSIVNQTYTNLEIILVDDGSPDNCPAKCDAWAKTDSRIKVIHKENGGGGDARNVGLDAATGSFIGMVDSDDYISPYMYEHLYSLMGPEIDITECAILKTEQDNARLSDGKNAKTHTYSVDEALLLHIEDTLFCQTPPNKLYRRSTLDHVRFPVGTRIDDEFWTYRILGNARKLVHSDCAMYAYRQQPDSVMHLSFGLPRLQAIDAKCERLEYINEHFPELICAAKANLWYTCLYMGQMSLLYMDCDDRIKAINKITGVLKQYSLKTEDFRAFSVKECLWFGMASISLRYTCKFRNTLKIGI